MASTRLFVGFTAAAALALLFTAVTPLRAAAVQALAIVTCASASACTGGTNTSTGPGVQGTSAKGKGVVGISTHGPGVFAQSSSGNGVTAQSTSAYGVQGTSSTGVGLSGVAPSGFGVRGTGSEGVIGSDRGTGDALLADGHGGRLIRANSSNGTDVFLLANDGTATFTNTVNAPYLDGGGTSSSLGVHGVGTAVGVEGIAATGCVTCSGLYGSNSTNGSSEALYLNGFGGWMIVGNGSSGHDVFRVDDAGNVHAHSFSADLAASQTTSNGSHLATYSSESRTPNIEDFGEATLTAGQAYVRLDSTFAAGIDRSRPYLVFITPQGAVGGTLYVAQKTSSGFAVRETVAARSNVAFDYRVVARPLAKPMTPSKVLSGTKPMPFMRKSVTIPRTHQQTKKSPIL